MQSSLLLTTLRLRKLGLGAVFLGAHACLTLLFHSRVELVSTIFMVVASLLAACSCCRAALRVEAAARPGWIFAASAMLVWGSGCALATWVDLVEHASNLVAGAPDFLFFFYGVAILLAATWSEDDALGGMAFWFDGLQATLASYLAYVAIFNVLPFSADRIQPIRAALLVPTYDVENAILVGLVVLRLIGRATSPSRWLFDRSMLFFTLTYGSAAAIYNHFYASTSSYHDIIIDIPFLILAATARSTVSQSCKAATRNFMALLVDSAGPIFFTAMVVSFGSIVAAHHVTLGIGGILAALLIYGLRAALLQSRYLRVQQALGEARDHLERLSLEDALTGVANRRHLDNFLKRSWDEAQRTRQNISFLLLDADHFKNLNDRQGHQAGDQCLIRIAAALLASTRQTDLVARYGGEEFAIVLPDTDLSGAFRVAETIRASVHAMRVANETRDGEHLTVSIGIASNEHGPQRLEFLVQAADRALYAAKLAGRDRIIAAPVFSIETAANEPALV